MWKNPQTGKPQEGALGATHRQMQNGIVVDMNDKGQMVNPNMKGVTAGHVGQLTDEEKAMDAVGRNRFGTAIDQNGDAIHAGSPPAPARPAADSNTQGKMTNAKNQVVHETADTGPKDNAQGITRKVENAPLPQFPSSGPHKP